MEEFVVSIFSSSTLVHKIRFARIVYEIPAKLISVAMKYVELKRFAIILPDINKITDFSRAYIL